MTPVAATGKGLRAWIVGSRAQRRLALRVTISAVVTLAASHALQLNIPLWAVLTAVMLTQLSVGRSLQATTNNFIGTIGAAAYAGAVGALMPDLVCASFFE